MPEGWSGLVEALVLFLATHALPVRPPVRRRLMALLGPTGFTLAYSALSIVMLGWLVVAARRAPFVELWPFRPWQTWVPAIAMPFVVALVSLAAGAPNPLSFGGGRDAAFDPARPGVVGLSRHPLLVALALWSGVHLVPNGDLAHVVLFGLFLGFAVLGMAIVDRRRRRMLGEGTWRRLAAGTGWLRPEGLATLFSGQRARDIALRLAVGGLVYAVLLHLHAPLIGVAPWPP